MPHKPNPELLDANAPEATEAWFVQARPASEVLLGLFGPAVAQEMLKPKRSKRRRGIARERKATQ